MLKIFQKAVKQKIENVFLTQKEEDFESRKLDRKNYRDCLKSSLNIDSPKNHVRHLNDMNFYN